jgi:branched-chain amino acid transport system ATP-binding protein
LTALLQGRALSKRFGAVVATADLDIEVRAGEIHAVIGPNGAGKSTLLGLLSGEVRPDSGRILLDGRDVTRMPVHRRARLGLGRTFQVSNVLPSFTVLENVAIAIQARVRSGLRLLKPADADPELNEPARLILERFSLLELADRRAAELAHGERRLLELALTLATKPRFLLLDEPFAGVAAGDSERLVRILDALRHDLGLLLVEHDMQAVFLLADRVTVLVQGRCIASGTPAEVRADSAVRAAYLGDSRGDAG